MWAVVCAVLSMVIGLNKGRGADGFFYGLLLGPIGILITAVLQPSDEYRKLDMERAAKIQADAIAKATTAAIPGTVW